MTVENRFPYHEYLVGHGWHFVGSGYYESRGVIEPADNAYEIEKYRQEIGIGQKIKDKEGGVQPVQTQPTKEPSKLIEQIIEKQIGGNSMKTKPWEDKETQALIEGYKTKTMKEIAQELKRPEGSIRNKIYELTKVGKLGKKPAVEKEKATKVATATPKAPRKTVAKAPRKTVAKPTAEKKTIDSSVALAEELTALAKKLIVLAEGILSTLNK